MKWTLLSVFLALLACSLLAYAFIPEPVGEDKTLVTWVSDNSPARRGTIDLFEQANPDLEVNLDPGNTGLEKVIVQCKGGIGPDIFNVYGRWQLLDYARCGVLVPLNEHAGEMGFGPDQTWDTVKREIGVYERDPVTGQEQYVQYTFPANVNANVMFYNRRLFREAGQPYPTSDWTWYEFLDVARQLIRRNAKGDVVQYALGTYEYLETVGLIWQFGGHIFDPTLTYCVVDHPEALEAITFLHRMLVIDEVMPSIAERDAMGTSGGYGGGLLDLFAHERIAMIRIGRWALVKLRTYYDESPTRPLRGEIGACQVPHQREQVGIVRAMSVGINPNSPNREEALRFLQFLASEEFSWEVARSADALPPSPDVAQSEDFLHDPEFPEEDFNAEFVEAMERGRSMEISPLIQTSRVEKAFNRYLALLSENKLSPEQMCRQITDELNTEIRANLMRYESMRLEYKRRTGHAFDPDNFPPREGDF